ncbi:MAG: NusG domain II-containing protein [Eubacterium sp.]|nr:NusG domain II-containing protein [Eubacterium sp.]
MKKNDFILIGIILVTAACIFAVLHFGVKGGAFVNVEADGKIIQSYSLSEDIETVIKTGTNDTNTLVIKDGCAYVSEASCPDKICVHHRKISKNGESIICLPHKLVISISNKSEAQQIDAVS